MGDEDKSKKLNWFEKLQSDFEQGFDKMQQDWKKFGDKVQETFTGKKPEGTTLGGDISTQSNAVESVNNNPNVASNASDALIVKKSNPLEENWNKMIKDSQNTFTKWQNDWKAMVETSQKRMILNKQKSKELFEESNQKAKEFFENQQKAVAEKLAEMDQNFKAKVQQSKDDQARTQELMKRGWDKFVAGQNHGYRNFMKMQNRLWWKGYFNFLIYIIFIVAILIGIISILQYYGFAGNFSLNDLTGSNSTGSG